MQKHWPSRGCLFIIPSSINDFHIQRALYPVYQLQILGFLNQRCQQIHSQCRPSEIKFFKTLLTACWKTFDDAVEMAQNHELKKGPRGGGRELVKIVEHVHDVDGGYLKKLGGTPIEGVALWESRRHILDELSAAVRGELPTEGPRGGKRWSPVYFVRRLAWHELDHAWEIEDRIIH